MTEIECKILIKRDGKSFLCPVKIGLIKEIIKTGSLRSAAKILNISYQHAWEIVEEINSAAPAPLIIKQRGGINGGGAFISDYGTGILKEYKSIETEISKIIKQINIEINL